MEQQDWRRAVLPCLPDSIRDMLACIPEEAPLEEIRLRAGQPLELRFSGYDRLVYAQGGRPAVTAADCEETLRRISEHSIYAWEEELRQGFVTLPGGCRVGLCGRAVTGRTGILRLSDITGLCIRIAHACEGAGEALLPYLADGAGRLASTLIVSPPGAGKTTLLRDIARLCSCGAPGLAPCRVCVVDTRYELAGCVRGEPQFDLGPRTDVLSGCGKAEGIRMMLRAMSPELIVVDELGTPLDIAAVLEAAGSGVQVLGGMHSGSAAMLQKRRSLSALLSSGLFSRYVILSRRQGPGTVEGVFDHALRQLVLREEATCRKSLPS